MSAIRKQSLGDFFIGQGDMIFWDSITDYSNATIASFVNGQSFGNIKEDSTSWTGEDMSETVIRNEQGNVIATTTTAGTLAYEATLAEMDNAMVKKLLKASDIDVSDLTVDWLQSAGTATAVGFGVALPVVEMPVAISNDTLSKTLVFPKAKVASTFVIEDKMILIKMSITAQAINTDDLKTGMIINGALSYAA